MSATVLSDSKVIPQTSSSNKLLLRTRFLFSTKTCKSLNSVGERSTNSPAKVTVWLASSNLIGPQIRSVLLDVEIC